MAAFCYSLGDFLNRIDCRQGFVLDEFGRFGGLNITERRTIYIGKKPVHAYIRAVVMTMESGDREVTLQASGVNISRAVDVAELCRRRNGIIAQGLPEQVEIVDIRTDSETGESKDGGKRSYSVIQIDLDGIGDVPASEEE